MERMEGGYESSDSGVYDFVDTAFPFKYPRQAAIVDRPSGAAGTSFLPMPTSGPSEEFPAPLSPETAGFDVSTDEEYSMGQPKRGVALIFNHEKFDAQCAAPNRTGTHIDRDALTNAFDGLGFLVRCFNDLPYREIRQVLEQVSREDHSEHNCIAVAVLSHGTRGNGLFARDRTYHINELVKSLADRHCPSLAGKPKLFFIQAGRAGDGSSFQDDIAYGDVLISHSTLEGAHSFRNLQTGAWYVQTLCSQLAAHGRTTELVSLLTNVSRIVNERFRSNNPRMPEVHGLRQQPCFSSSLKRRLCFR